MVRIIGMPRASTNAPPKVRNGMSPKSMAILPEAATGMRPHVVVLPLAAAAGRLHEFLVGGDPIACDESLRFSEGQAAGANDPLQLRLENIFNARAASRIVRLGPEI